MEPDYSYLPGQNFDWTHTVYHYAHEIIPEDVEKLQFSFPLDLLSPEISYSLGSFCDFPKDCLFTCFFQSL